MATFFQPFPTINYNFNGTPIQLTNITLRYKIRDVIFSYVECFYSYNVKEGEKPWMIADWYYDDMTLSEIILLTNHIQDPYFQWPMTYDEFGQYILSTYGSIQYATQNIHSYYMIVQPRTVLADGTIIAERDLRVDQTTYLSLPANQRTELTYYDYEMQQNENRRTISLIKKSYMPQIKKEIANIFV